MSRKQDWEDASAAGKVGAFYNGLCNEVAFLFGYDAFQQTGDRDDLPVEDNDEAAAVPDGQRQEVPPEIWAQGPPVPANFSAEDAATRNKQHTALRKVSLSYGLCAAC